LNEAFLQSTVLVMFQSSPNMSSVGTGFFVFRPLEGDKGHVLLVTNKHVLPPVGQPKSVQIRVSIGSSDKTEIRLIEIPVVDINGKYLPNVKTHPKAGFDVAVINVTDAIVKEHVQGTWLPLDLFATSEKLKNENITVGDDIFLLGYPDAIFDARNVSPVLRTGVIATVPTQGYAFNETLRQRFGLPDRIDGFLIDANVFPGSSGSVVILKQQATTMGPQGETVISGAKKIPYVLGIVSGSIPIADSALGTVQRMGLGIVYSADAIRAVIEQLYK
jgi:Trypsin-like peptidase domain